jgi:hypothetical protein
MLVLAAVVRPAVDDGFVERGLCRREVGPVVRGRTERPVRGDGGLDVIPVQRERQSRSHERNALLAATRSSYEEPLGGQALRLEIRALGAPCGLERTLDQARGGLGVVVPHGLRSEQ